MRKKKQIIGIILAAALVAGGLGSFAYANPEPVNQVHANFSTYWEYNVSGDSFTNGDKEVTGWKRWGVILYNPADETGAPVKGLNLSLDTELAFDGVSVFNGELETPGPPVYEWSFGNVAEGASLPDLPHVNVAFWRTPHPFPVTFTPGFNASRSADKTEFLQSEGTQPQTLTITLTRVEEQVPEDLCICVQVPTWIEWQKELVDAVINAPTGVEFALTADKQRLWIWPRGLTVGEEWTITVTIEVTPKVPEVTFMPSVYISWQGLPTYGTDTGNSLSHTVEQMGTWTWSAGPWNTEASYIWDWEESVVPSVEFHGYCQGNEVQVGFCTAGLYAVSGDDFINHAVTGSSEWFAVMTNLADETGAPVTGLTLTLDSLLEFDRVFKENLVILGPPTYKWFLGALPQDGFTYRNVRFLTPDPFPVNFTPGFDASRTLSQTEFLQSEGTQTQTVTITVTPREEEVVTSGYWLIAVAADHEYFAPDEYDLVDAVITSPGGDGHMLIMSQIPGLELDKEWTTTVEIEVTPKVPQVEFVPCVHVNWFEPLAFGTTVGSSVSYRAGEVGHEVGTWTVSADGSYVWHRWEWLYRAVEWQPCYREIVNIPPIAQASIDPYLAPVGSVFTFDGSASYDPDGTIEFYDWDFGDGNSDSGVSVTHAYSAPGLYDVVLTVSDDMEAESTDSVMAVVYDPEAGFATGGGWLIPGGKTSDLGDMLPGLDNTSPANFGFVVKYKPGATTPSGQLEFHYQQGDFNLHSSGMEWLVIVNNRWAKFQGVATIKGLEGLFPFRVDARDGDFGGGDQPDRFIIKVYAPGADPDSDEPIYKASGDLEGGSIVIHAKKK